MKGLLSIIFVVFILLIAIALGSQNNGEITVNYLLAQATIDVSTFIAITLGLGVIVGVLLMLPVVVRLKVALTLQRRKQQ